jgi:hypothetical protein
MKALRLALLMLVFVPAFAQNASPAPPTATVRVTHGEAGQASRLEVRIEPAIGNREIFISIGRGRTSEEGLWQRRRLQPLAPGRYELAFPFAEPGPWGVYLHYGSGLAGFDAYTRLDVRPVPGETATATTAFRSWPNQAQSLPAWVQPLGYGGFATVTAFILFAVGRLLGRVKGQLVLEEKQ